MTGEPEAVDPEEAPKIHAWRIEEREYLRQEQHRGSRFANERINPERTALVVIDMVPFFVDQSRYARGVVPNIARIASGLRAAGGTIAWIVPTGLPARAEFFGARAAAGAATLGYRVIMVADANAARRDEDHNATLHTIYRTFGDVRPTSDVLDLIHAGASQGF